MGKERVTVALVGCGQIADAHLQEIRRIPCAELVAVCDQHRELADQAGARFAVPAVFDDLGQMLEHSRPDAVHVTTPPHTHHSLALRCLAAGAHVYLEKPFTVNAAEAAEVLAASHEHQRIVCVGHDHLFDPAWQECRELYRRGELGEVVHVDAVLGYDLSGTFGKAMMSDRSHWVHRLPGGLFHNNISHALYKITDFLPDERPRVWASWFSEQRPAACPTELRVMLQGKSVTGSLIFTSRARPVMRVTRVYGTRRCVEVDQDGRLLRHTRPAALRGPFQKLEVPARQLAEAALSLRRNLGRFFRCELHFFTGMYQLFSRFYRAILTGGAPPIPYAEIHRVTDLMDRIFAQCRGQWEPEGLLPVAAGRTAREEVDRVPLCCPQISGVP